MLDTALWVYTFPSPLSEKPISHQHEFCLSRLGIDQDWMDP